MENLLLVPVVVPIAAGVICLLVPDRVRRVREALAVGTLLAAVAWSVFVFLRAVPAIQLDWLSLSEGFTAGLDFSANPFAKLTLVIASGFGLLAVLYSIPLLARHPRHREYYTYFLAALGVTAGAVLAGNLIVLLLFWELHGLLLYLMAGINGQKAVSAATRTLIIAGLGDLAFLLGVGFIWVQTGSLSLNALGPGLVPASTTLSASAFVLIMLGTFVKIGIMPMHSWITAISTETPMTVMSYFTALDKMLGFYVVGLTCFSIFDLASWRGWFLMTMGAISLLCGVLMAMVQGDYRKMLAFHSVSQMGYALLGIGTGTVVGIVGGLFHVINMVIVKGALFLCGGSVERSTGRAAFSTLGGLARTMPLTFLGTLIAALAISGVPPFNAFVSKWLLYQGILERGGPAFPVFLLIAMFGSALTLASFMKLLYSMFWASRPADLAETRESPAWMTIPILVLAVFAAGFGIFYRWPIDVLLAPILKTAIEPGGIWQSAPAAILILLSLLVGWAMYLAGRPRASVEAEVFVGGEAVQPELYRVPGTHFYGPVKGMAGLRSAYAAAERGTLDLYKQGGRVVKGAADWVYKYIDQALADFYQEIIPALWSLIGQLLRVLNRNMILTKALWVAYAVGVLALLAVPGSSEVLAVTRAVACAGMLGWAFLAWVEGNLSRLLILAASSQFGFVVLGASLSSNVAVSYLLTGGVALALLFLLAYFIRRQMHTDQIVQMGGLASRSPMLFVLFLIAALWLAGLPPFGSFFSKFLLGVAAGEISPLLSVVITFTAILTLSYLLRPIRRFLRVP